MDEPRLSESEQRILRGMEILLARDKGLDRRLSTLHLSRGDRCREVLGCIRVWVFTVLAVTSAILLAAAVRTGVPGFGVAAVATGAAAVAVALSALWSAWRSRAQR